MDQLGEANGAKRESQITIELKGLEDASDRLQNAVSEMMNRLTPVVHPEPPKVSGGDINKEPLVPMAQGLREIRERIESQSCCLEDLLVRLEL